MPTYEYQCDKCETVFDVFQSIKAGPLKKAECPKCGTTRPVKRLIGTGGAVIFKGAGFYQTDYRSEGYKTAAKAESGDSTPSKDSDSKAGDTKAPEAKAEKPATKSEGGAKDTKPPKKPGKK